MIELGTTCIANREIRYTTKISPTSKHAQLKFKPNLELEVTVPFRSKADVQMILRKKRGWIQRKYEEITSRIRVFDDKRVLYRGTYHEISFIQSKGQAKVSKGKITIPIYNGIAPQEALRKWMMHKTEVFVKGRLANYSKQFGLSYDGVSVQDVNKWAHCTKNGNLVFNWQLIALPTELINYVIAHEITHLSVFSHSKKFRYKLASICPNFREKEAMLKHYAFDLAKSDFAQPAPQKDSVRVQSFSV